jgi:hypothetical protein
VLQVLLGTDSVALDDGSSALAHHLIELAATHGEPASPPGPGRHEPRDLVDQRRSPVAELIEVKRRREQPDPAVDVVADAAR